jgi:cyclophilin family peptidyl-prolyl cis-trans isomerase
MNQSTPRVRRWLVVVVAVAVALAAWLVYGRRSAEPRTDDNALAQTAPRPDVHGSPPPEQGSSFLEAFGAKGDADAEPVGPALTDEALQERFQDLLEIRDQLQVLEQQVEEWKDAVRQRELQRAKKERGQLEAEYNRDLTAFEKELARARQARPNDGIPVWLTGELLKLIGGDPDAILPHLRRALDLGLARPRVLASLSRTQTEANQFEEALVTARQALDVEGQDWHAWDAFTRAAFYLERYGEVVSGLQKAFPGRQPDWVAKIRSEAAARQLRSQAEQRRREADARADNLPRVRLVIEHRRFARDEHGAPLTKIESTGRGEVLLELFEDQAPASVANFLSLVQQKKYDGTRFFLAEGATLVAGGDVGSRSNDPSEDGKGSPGYFIPDEFERKDARPHGRGALSMIHKGEENTAGSQFFITLVPMPEMDGKHTVFGRVLQGQDVINRITRGRTNRLVGRKGRIIPGDLLIHAEIVRKRDHEYRVIKVTP